MILAHLADLHLGFRAYERTDRGRNVRETDVAGAFMRAVGELVKIRPDVVLVAGDVFDRPDPPASALVTCARGLEVLRSALPETQVLVAGGARDTPRHPGDPGVLAALDTLPGVEAAAGPPRSVRVGEGALHVQLLPHRAALSEPAVPEPDPYARWNVLVTHARTPGGGAGRGPRIDLRAWDYVALGGEHVHRLLLPHVGWAGSLERVTWSPWNEALEDKGFVTYDLEARRASFHALPVRAVVSLAPVRVPEGDPDRLRLRLREVIDEVPGGIEGKIVLVRVQGAAPADLSGLVDELLPVLRERALHLSVSREDSPRPRAVPGPDAELHSRLVELLMEEGIAPEEATLRASALLGSAPERAPLA